MTSYLSSFATRWESEFQIDLIQELRDALRDTPRKARFGALFAEFYQILNFCVEVDGIHAWLGKKRAVLELTAAFLAQHKHQKAHQVISEVLASSLPAKAMKSKKIDISALLLELSNQANFNLNQMSKGELALAQYAAINKAFAQNPESELENKLHTVVPVIALSRPVCATNSNTRKRCSLARQVERKKLDHENRTTDLRNVAGHTGKRARDGARIQPTHSGGGSGLERSSG